MLMALCDNHYPPDTEQTPKRFADEDPGAKQLLDKI